MPQPLPSPQAQRLYALLLTLCISAANTMYLAITLYSNPLYWKQPYHTSKLSGHAWVQELIHGHPDRIRTELGMWLHVFLAFVNELRGGGLCDTRYVKAEEQAAIFLYMCVTGLRTRHVGERFQHANATISK